MFKDEQAFLGTTRVLTGHAARLFRLKSPILAWCLLKVFLVCFVGSYCSHMCECVFSKYFVGSIFVGSCFFVHNLFGTAIVFLGCISLSVCGSLGVFHGSTA